jgi:hypothetical protein
MSEITRRVWQVIRQPWRLAVPLKRLAIILLLLAVVALATWWALHGLRSPRRFIAAVVILWLVAAYLILPRIHRLLSRIYVPNYFIGRARTADGLLADPVNMAIRGDREMLINAMHKAGWVEAERLSLKSAIRFIGAILRGRSYANAPVSNLFVFGRKQSLSFQKEVDSNPSKRHHVRFWHVPSQVYLPGGYNVDWVGAATYDDAVGLSLFTFQLTHSIDGDVDVERDFVVDTIKSAHRIKHVERIERFFPGYVHRNGGGDKFFTDGSMVIVDLKKGLLH